VSSWIATELPNEINMESPKPAALTHATLSMKPAERLREATMMIVTVSAPPAASLREFTTTPVTVPMSPTASLGEVPATPAIAPTLPAWSTRELPVSEIRHSVHPEAVPHSPEQRPRTGAGRLEASEAT
jgi:hypothetical protein